MIRELAGLLAETGLTEIEYAIGDHRIRVAREPAGIGHATPPPAAGSGAPAEGPAAPLMGTNGAANGTTNGATNGATHPGTVTSPIVGIAFLAPQPGAAPFVRIGDSVSPGQTLLIIEAMKVMNQISAPQAGRVVKIFAGDGEPVEYGAALMLIE